MNLRGKDVHLIKNAAIQLENHDIEMAYKLMSIAYKAKPDGRHIKQKINQYKRSLRSRYSDEKSKINSLVNNREICIIPIGFRCFTKKWIHDNLGVKQPSLPFDSGFFSPFSVASLLRNPTVSMNMSSETHNVCIKTSVYHDDKHGSGIAFESSDYETINNIVKEPTTPKINKYLDSTFGYYTLNKQHKFILAHYNWHKLSDIKKSKGITNPEENLNLINSLFERRIERMFNLIKNSNKVILLFLNNPKNKYLKIDDEFYFLDEIDHIKNSLNSFKKDISIINIDNTLNAKTFLERIND